MTVLGFAAGHFGLKQEGVGRGDEFCAGKTAQNLRLSGGCRADENGMGTEACGRLDEDDSRTIDGLNGAGWHRDSASFIAARYDECRDR